MGSWGKFWAKDTKGPKNATATSEEPGAKTGCRGANAGYCMPAGMPPALNTHPRRGGQNT